MSRLLKITDLGSGIMVQGTDNVLYPDNATLTYPYNSIIVVTDESNIATFRSASNNDVLFSGLIGKVEIGGEIVTKENINTKFDQIANQESGGGGGGTFADASYDSQTKRINFYDKDGNIVSYIDATDFIKDGMVSNVEILNGNLVITFNTDSGKQPISIPLTDIFNPDEYYTKTQVDTALSAKVSQTEFDTKEEVISTALNELEENKQDKLTAGSNITIDANNVISSTGGTQVQADWNQSDSSAVDYIKNKPTIPDTSDFVSKTEYNPKEVAIAEALTELNENKADKTELPDVSTFATKTELNAKQDALVSGTNIKTINNQSILGDGNIVIQGGGGGTQVQSDWNQTDTTAVDYIKNKPTNVSAFTNDAGYLTQHQSLANYYTKSEIDAMIGNINTILASI